MTFGEALKLVFEAHYEDLGSKENRCTRYTNEKLLTALKIVPWKWKKYIFQEFSIVVGVIRRAILACPHKEFTEPYSGRRECNQCGSHQNLELEDKDPNSYNERKIWGEWEVL